MRSWCALAVMAPHLCLAQGLVLGTQEPPQAPPACITVSASGAESYGCPTDPQHALKAQHQAALATANGYDNHAPPQRLGLYNQAATREQFGNTFGKSTIPQQLPKPNYASPLMPH